MKELMDALRRNNMTGHIAADENEALKIIKGLIKKDDVIGFGGSLSVRQIGIVEALRKDGNKVLDWYDEKDHKTKNRILHETFNSDVFISGTNALTMDGKLYNIDGRGNRVAAMAYGPEKVIIVCGRNKIVSNIREAKERLETVAGPLNAKKLDKKTGCRESGYCIDCHLPERLCCTTAITEYQCDPGRMHIVIIDKELGL
jgi:L-lactate utilization protein LutB